MTSEIKVIKFGSNVTHVRHGNRIYGVSEKTHKVLLKSFEEYKSINLAKRASTELQKDSSVVLRRVA